MSSVKLTHVNYQGDAHMVDVSSKEVTRRTATARALIKMSSEARQAIKDNTLAKGEALGTARVAGILAAKRVPDLIPLCHSLPISSAEIEITPVDDGYAITATVITEAKTGVEMEALTACTISALTIYDMAKSVDKSMVVSEVRLLHKSGGRSGEYRAKE